MIKLFFNDIQNDLLKLGILVDGFWDEVFSKLGTKFTKLDEDISILIEKNGFKKEEKILVDNHFLNIFIRREKIDKKEAVIIQKVDLFRSGVWSNLQFIGLGDNETIQEIKKFLTETVKFTAIDD